MTNTDSYIRGYFAAVDANDSHKIASYFTEDGSFRFGNPPATIGRDAIEAANVEFFGMIGGLHHEITGIWESTYGARQDAIIFVELAVTYTRRDGSQTAPLPVISQIRMQGDQMHDFRIFGDIAPAFEV